MRYFIISPGICLALLVQLAMFWPPVAYAETPLTSHRTILERQGTEARLRGDFASATRAYEQMLALQKSTSSAIGGASAPEPAAQAFLLDTLVTHLSWAEDQDQFDKAFLGATEDILAWCEPRLDSADNTAAHFYCGRAHFSLSFYHGVRGNFITAGRHGTNAIEHTEIALEQDPNLMEARMFLGTAYYYADNLPAFIKLLARALWFIPTGNSDKSVPYIRTVMESQHHFNDVARYLYATLLLRGDDTERVEAAEHIKALVTRYPENPRFLLRLASVLIDMEQFDEALAYITRFDPPAYVTPLDISLLTLWQARAELGNRNITMAATLLDKVSLEGGGKEPIPDWSHGWYWLSRAQIADLQGNREAALKHYRQVIELDDDTYVSRKVLASAREGLQRRFTPTESTSAQ